MIKQIFLTKKTFKIKYKLKKKNEKNHFNWKKNKDSKL